MTNTKKDLKTTKQETPEKFYFKNAEGVKEEVKLEAWIWAVIYKDGKELRQFTPDGVFHQFREIDQDQVKLFIMLNVADNTRRFDIVKTKDMQIFHFYRICGTIDGNGRRENRIYCFGYKDRKTKKQLYHFILPNKTLLIADENVKLEEFGAFN